MKMRLLPQNEVSMEDVELGFSNFKGKKTDYTKEGDRNFTVRLDEENANILKELGWNVKWPKERIDEGTGDAFPVIPYLQIGISFENYPATMYMITPLEDGTTNTTKIMEDEINMLDWAELSQVDIVIRPYTWEVQGKTGIKAYLKSGYFTIIVDAFAQKYGV